MVSLVVLGGKNAALKRIFGSSQNPIAYMGVGTSQNTPTEASTSLGAECSGNGYARVAVTNTYDEGNKRVVSDATFPTTNITGSTTVREIALFDDATSGTMFGISQVAATPKDGSVAVKFRITTSVV